ncbi:hypothetical protein J4771_02345 [Candidatus Kaistella beijingensis]|uniref:hypothetical protein n=1 Tax=Candidatus Kaistella beijingensis TaxID=2820270 RepID=UPI001CC6BF22|nr:hypothetical protein [Candidatus Kaistella beijingensis]UBB90216.1 hypothetical protein J4771_02345 [Candidatus Kaistella beijingensis]
MITNSTKKELENVIKTALYKSTEILPLSEVVCFNLTSETTQYYFQIIYRGYNSYSGYTYVLKPLFNYVHKYF